MASKSRKPIDLGFDNYNELFMTEQERKDNDSNAHLLFSTLLAFRISYLP